MKLTKELYESTQKERNIEKYGDGSDQCLCCGKPMSEDDGTRKSIHMNTDWVAVHNSVDWENCEELTGADTQGSFPIGNSCAKKMGKGFVYDPASYKEIKEVKTEEIQESKTEEIQEKKLSIHEKRQLLSRYVESLVCGGYEFGWIFAKPLNFFDYDAVIKETEKNRAEQED